MKALFVVLLSLALVGPVQGAEPDVPAASCWILCRDEGACAAACERGDETRCLALALKLDGAERGKADPLRAATLFKALCQRGNPQACFKLSEMHAQPRGVALNWERAESLALGACEAGLVEACQQVFEVSSEASPSRPRAERTMARLCDAGSAEACDALAVLAKGRGQSDDAFRDKRAAAYRKQCEGGDGRACRWLSWHLEHKQPPEAKAAEEMRRRALVPLVDACQRGGDPEACIASAEVCGTSCKTGGKTHGGSRLRVLAVKQLIKLCEAGDGDRCNQAGLEISEQAGKNANVRALTWFRRACMEGWVDACESAAMRTKEGKGGHRERLALYRQACLLGSESACAQFGEEVQLTAPADRDAEDQGQVDDEDEEPPELIALRKEALAIEARACKRGDWEACTKAAAELEQAEQIDEARTLLELACDKGLGSACQVMAYWHQVMIVHKDPAEEMAATLSAHTRACAAGALPACERAWTLARAPAQRAPLRPAVLRTALKICQDDASARRSLDRAQEQGSACVLAAVLAREDAQAVKGVPSHKLLAERALELARRRCEKKKACPEVADLLGDRRLSVYDPARAAELREGACNEGYSQQCLLLARQYVQGEGVAKDEQKAQEILVPRCAKRNAGACGEMAKHGWRLPTVKAGKQAPKPATKLPEPAEKLDLPLKVPGCPGEHCACIVSKRLASDATLLEEPEDNAPALVELSSGTLIARAAIFEMIDLPGVARLGGACDESKPDKPGPPLHYLGYAGEGAHLVWLDGRRREVDDCEIAQLLAEPSATIWVEITTRNGKTGYTRDWGAVERGMPSAKQSCLY